MKYKKTYETHGVSESAINWVNLVVEVYYKEMMKKFSDTKNETCTKHSADFNLIYTTYGDKKYIEKFIHKDDILLKIAEKWSIKFNLYGVSNVKDYPIDIQTNCDFDDKAINLIVNVNFNEDDWKSILTNDDFLDELEDTLTYEFTKLVEKANMKKEKKNIFHRGYQFNAIRNYLRIVIEDDNYAMIYFVSCLSLALKHEINARVNQFFKESERFEIDSTSDFIKIWKDSVHFKIYEALHNFNAYEIIKEIRIYGGDKYLKEFIAEWQEYATSNDELEDAIINEKYINNPESFLKHWEKIFHNSAKYYKRKCMKIYSSHFSMEDIKELRKTERANKKEDKTTTYANYHHGHYCD